MVAYWNLLFNHLVTVALFFHDNPPYEFGIFYYFFNFLLPSGENLPQKNYWSGSSNHRCGVI
jgi:hypothetical protein